MLFFVSTPFIVSQQREFFTDLKKQDKPMHKRRQPPVFLPRSVVAEVNDEVVQATNCYAREFALNLSSCFSNMVKIQTMIGVLFSFRWRQTSVS